MGSDKALIDLEGVALGRRVAEALGANDGRTVLACGGSAEVAHSLGLEHLPDEVRNKIRASAKASVNKFTLSGNEQRWLDAAESVIPSQDNHQ